MREAVQGVDDCLGNGPDGGAAIARIDREASANDRQVVHGPRSQATPACNWIVDAIRPLARQIELLSPAVKAGGRSPQNCEYPWVAADGSITAPADHRFEFSILFEKAGVTLLKIVRQAALELQGAP
jgi:hypothetical protein